jgi:hypothetical protein
LRKNVIDKNTLNITETGVHFSNPTDNFTQRNKETFQTLRQDKIDPNEREKPSQTKDRNKRKETTTASSSLLNLNVDEFSEIIEGKKLKLYRPNMENLTLKDIESFKPSMIFVERFPYWSSPFGQRSSKEFKVGDRV